MKIELPLFTEVRREPDQPGSIHIVRPLFYDAPREQDRNLSRATSRLVTGLQRELAELGKRGEHQALAGYTFCPVVHFQRLKLRLALAKHSLEGHFPLVTFKRFDRTLAFSPLLLSLWFEVRRGETLPARAEEVYTRHFRRIEKDGPEILKVAFAPFAEKFQSWVSTVEFDVSTKQSFESPEKQLFALLGGSATFEGAYELGRVGRSQDLLYPDRLDRAWHREDEVAALLALLASPDRRPVLVVGPPQVGKTALIQECVHRRVAQRRSIFSSRQNVWLLAPLRLISGMSYVGQWENRLLAILKTAKKREHVLYFDDLLGLYRAGISASSNLSVADVLRPYIERRDVRVLAEMTPESLRVLRERDRGLADMFQIVRLAPPDEPLALRMLLASIRALEGRHGCRFALDALPTVTDLVRRYFRDAALPGKAASFLSRLAVKFADQEIGRRQVLDEFHAASGLGIAFLDAQRKMPRQSVLDVLGRDVVGQPLALSAFADVVQIAKARLNDPGRPLGSLLLLGPTGVGKTHSAKSLARFLFGDEARLLRFDMNEYVAPGSAARLVGTFDQPEGLLTSAVRRQPFSVVLFDEIEKAHGDVHDLLLQVLGEGRLTDGLGRTADFTNTVILLTSNLGTCEAAVRIGFDRAADNSRVYVKAAEDFFRPEFFNRLDRIIPFDRLERAELRQIARALIDAVVAREGLVRRKSALAIDDEAVEWVVERGYHPELGARAMRRAVERELVQPVAAELAGLSQDVPIVLEATRGSGERLAVRVTPLVHAASLAQGQRPAAFDDPRAMLDMAEAFFDRVEEQLEDHRPAMLSPSGKITPEYVAHLASAECLKDGRAFARRLGQSLEEKRPRATHAKLPMRQAQWRTRRSRLKGWDNVNPLHDLFAAEDQAAYWRDVSEQAEAFAESRTEDRLRTLLDKASLLDALAPAESGWTHERLLLIVRAIGRDTGFAGRRLAQSLATRFSFRAGQEDDDAHDGELTVGFEPTVLLLPQQQLWPGRAFPYKLLSNSCAEADATRSVPATMLDILEFEGHRAAEFISREVGTHLYTQPDGRLIPICVTAWPLAPEETSEAGLARFLATARTIPPVVRMYGQPPEVVVDLRTGLTASPTDPVALAQTMLALLPLPPELKE